MTNTNLSLSSAQIAAEAEAREQEARKLRELEKEKRREEKERDAAEKQRQRALDEAQAECRRELDDVLAVVNERLPGFDQLAARIDAAMERYRRSAASLGDRWPDQQLVRHPVGRVRQWLEVFVAPAKEGNE